MNGQHFILWTEYEGGFFKGIKVSDRALYDDAVATGTLKVPQPDVVGNPPDERPCAFIAFGTVEANHDFHLGSSREDYIARKEAVA